MKREYGVFVNKASACIKSALKQMIKYLYSTTVSAADYQDAALQLHHVILAIALALVTRTSQTLSLLIQLPDQVPSPQFSVAPATPLIDLIDHPEVVLPSRAKETSIKNDQSQDTVPGVHSYINRVLDRSAGKAGVAERLTSHSFRRGGEQHANGAALCSQWIFARGAWDMTATNEAFAYVFNKPSEDHKVTRVLGDHDPERLVKLLSLNGFDSDTKLKIRSVAASLFNASYDLQTAPCNVDGAVIGTVFAYLLRHYASLKQLRADGLAIKRLESYAIEKGYSINELLARSSHITCNPSTGEQHDPIVLPSSKNDITNHPTSRQKAALIDEFIQLNKKLDTHL
ncbi:hypothetical protein PHMEG_00035269 [Phytophthora megakarya]|uniref:Uncharacterized protein n=1 Tax=Phytophthora megakarya TaxID=4795 RepID=A0A225UPJ1_9STRA|nr:hypothetical protein PHMEG_00035269 [Phytophthora megakarya]